MTVTREQMDRIKRHLNGDKSEAMGAWILDKNALNLALARETELKTKLAELATRLKKYGGDDFGLAADEIEGLLE